MFKWIKNKFSGGTLEETSHEERNIQESIVHRESLDVQNEQRCFRFPLIPDETVRTNVSQQVEPKFEVRKENNNLKQPKQNYQKEYSSLFLHEETKKEKSHKLLSERDNPIFSEQRRQVTRAETSQYTPPKVKETVKFKPQPTIKKSFKPTQIPSPVYGFKQRPNVEKKDEINIPRQMVKEPERKVVENLQSIRKQEELRVEPIREVENVEEKPLVKVTEKLDKPLTKVIEEVRNIEEKQPLEVTGRTDTPAKMGIEEVKEEVVAEVGETLQEKRLAIPQETKSQEQPKQKKRVVPFNVMMLKQDREKMMRAREERGMQSERPKVSQVVHKQEEPLQPASVPAIEEMPAKYAHPSLSLLQIPTISQENDDQWIDEQAQLLQETLANFNVGAQVVDVIQGPSVTRFEIQPDPGVKVNKITNLTDDIKLSLAAKDIRIEAPIPGKSAVGIEVPNRTSKPVLLSEVLKTPEFQQHPSPLAAALGLDIAGNPIVTDIQKMPHGLIAGATGSGKSVCINAILLSILYKAAPHEVKLMLIDPKMVELAPYNNIPHLVAPVITDVKAATAALKWAVEEMEKRYELFAHAGARDLSRYNQLVERHGQGEKLPYLVIVIDELADLMMVAPGDVEEAICRIAQKARACGIHMILATQRPSVDVITGLIKANIPTRLAFTVSSQIDSRTIIDMNGAEKLLGRGDMLFLENGSSKPIRAQGVYVSDDEIEEVVSYAKKQMKPNYLFEQEDLVTKHGNHEVDDELFEDACEYVVNMGGASASSLQRHFRIGYNRAARLIEMMEAKGFVSEARGSKPRDILISIEDLFSKR